MKILFVDDESRRMEPIVEELKEKGYGVVFQETVDNALALLKDPKNKFDLLILDVSMPPGKSFQNEYTEEGTRTGLVFYNVVRQLLPELKIVVFTNVADRTVEDHFKNENPSFYKFIRKLSVLPYEFVEEIEEFMRATMHH